VVVGVRADFYGRCAEYPELITVIQDHQVVVGSMSGAELRQVIEGPAAQAGWVLEAGLAETVLADLGEEPGLLPLLPHALQETWMRWRGHTLTLAGYRDAGGVRQAIGQTAEAVYVQLDPAQQAVAKDVFLRLTALGEAPRTPAGVCNELSWPTAGTWRWCWISWSKRGWSCLVKTVWRSLTRR
jgi:hypothetical protein